MTLPLLAGVCLAVIGLALCARQEGLETRADSTTAAAAEASAAEASAAEAAAVAVEMGQMRELRTDVMAHQDQMEEVLGRMKEAMDEVKARWKGAATVPPG